MKDDNHGGPKLQTTENKNNGRIVRRYDRRVALEQLYAFWPFAPTETPPNEAWTTKRRIWLTEVEIPSTGIVSI